jgi:hypothetical protein
MFYQKTVNNQTKLVASRDCALFDCKELEKNIISFYKDISIKDLTCKYCTTDNCNNNVYNSSTRVGIYYLYYSLLVLAILLFNY